MLASRGESGPPWGTPSGVASQVPSGRTTPAVRYRWIRPSTLRSLIFSCSCPHGACPGKSALLPGTIAAFTSVAGPAILLCCANSSRHRRPCYAVLVHRPAGFRHPSSRRSVTLPALASRGRYHMFMCGPSDRGLAPHLQRAHAGRTQGTAPLPRDPRAGHSEGEC